MDCSTPGLPVHHQLLELTPAHVHRVSDAIQSSHPLSSVSPPAFNLSQHQGLFSQIFTSGGQSIGVSALASVLPMNIQYWFPLGWTGWISLLSKGLSRDFSSTSLKASILQCSAFFMVQLSHPYVTARETIALTRWAFDSKVMSLLFKYAIWVCYSFPSKEQASFNFMAAVIVLSNLGAQENKICHCFHFFPFYLP